MEVVVQVSDLITNVNRTVNDFESIKQAIIDKGVDVPFGTATSQYSELINEIQGGSGDEPKGKILCNMPLTSDLSDISGFNRAVEYTGVTPLTIDENGIYLYYGKLDINNDFLKDVPRYIFEFDIKINPNGTDENPYWRRALALGSIGFEIYYLGNMTTNQFVLAMYNNLSNSATSPSAKSYADSKYHHISLYHYAEKRFVLAVVDNNDIVAMIYVSNPDMNIILGHENTGLNGYIKNLIIREF